MNYQTSCLISLFPIRPYGFFLFLTVYTTVTNDRMSFAFCRYLEAFVFTYVDTHNVFIVVHGGSSGTASAMNDNQMKNVLSRMGSEKRSTRN